jgi:hypothetical protein
VTAGLVEDGVAVVMPAFREEANLTDTVEDMLSTLDTLGDRHVIVIVNDGSDDKTGAVADKLAARHPGRVRVVHHEVNRGYGAAVRTGIATALAETDASWLFLTDSDGQFRAAELPVFIAEARSERADAVIGFRPRRADPPMRKVNAWLWTRAAGVLLGVGARDVDCAYKLVGRRVLDGVELRGDKALIAPELLMRIRAREARILQRPVRHYPRLHGEQTGAKLSVILPSLIGLVGLWLGRMRSALPGRLARAVLRPRDPAGAVVSCAAAVAAVVSYLLFAATHTLLAYPETVRGLLIARRIAEGTGFAPVGSVWLPLWHLLAAATAWNDAMYYSGLSGSVISMLAYVAATRYLYRTALALAGSRLAGVTAAVVFAANPGVLYLQSMPVHALLLIACTAAMAYHLTLWCKTGSYRQLVGTSAAALLASVTSYTGWGLDLAAAFIVCYVAWRRAPSASWPRRLRQVEAHLLFYGLPVLAGIGGWLAWNTAIEGNPLGFVGAVAAAGFGESPGTAVVPAAALIPAALCAGLLAASLRRLLARPAAGYASVAALTAALVAAAALAGIPTLRQARAAAVSPAAVCDARAGAWLRAHYSGGLVLMASAGNEAVLFDSRIPLGEVIYEGDTDRWSRALADPFGEQIRWIYARRTPGDPDQVWLAPHGPGKGGADGAAPRLPHYNVGYSDSFRVIYREG